MVGAVKPDRNKISGIGMTSARTRERLVQRLEQSGISTPMILDRIRSVPRHLFVDEALERQTHSFRSHRSLAARLHWPLRRAAPPVRQSALRTATTVFWTALMLWPSGTTTA